VPSDENLATLRRLAAREFKAFDNAPGKVNLRFREAIATFLPKKGWS
jgi:hypothetical protein